MSEQLIKTPGVFGENGNFLLERELGSGGMGGVYMGRDKMLDRPVAVKVMLKEYGSDPEFVEKFKKEAQSAARLIHPNIAQIYSYGIADGMPYIAMELVAGGSLWGIMKNNPGKTEVPRVLKICQQVAQALQCSTDQGCVHGDIKPENILLDANGNAKIVDFGLAGMQKDTKEIWGTPYYIAPEKVKQEVVDYRADMYNLGGTLYHALTGVPPFDGEDVNAVVKARFMGPPKKPSELRPDLSPQVDALVMKMLAFEKADRFPSFEALIEEFKRVLTVGLETARIAPVSAPAKPGTRKVTMRTGRRVTTMKMRAAAAGAEKPAEAEEAANAASGGDDDEEEGGGNLGLKVLGVVAGVVLLVGGVIGGLIWFKVSSKRADEAAVRQQIVDKTREAREAIASTRDEAVKFAEGIAEMASNAVARCQKASDELKRHMPDFADLLQPAPTKELLDAIAAANPAPASAEAPAAVEPPATNAAPAAAEATAKDAGPAPTAETAPQPAPQEEAAAEPQREVPQAVNEVVALWERAYGCQAGAILVRLGLEKTIAACDSAAGMVGETPEALAALAKLSQDAKEMFEEVKSSKNADKVRKSAGYIKERADKVVTAALERLRIEEARRKRMEDEENRKRVEEEEKTRLAAERAELVAAETASAGEKFDAIVASGKFRQLDWKGATRDLDFLKGEMKTPEGEIAVDFQKRKVNAMKAVHDILRKNLPGYTFRRGKQLKGRKVAKATESDIVFAPDGKSPSKITFVKFYQACIPNLNEAFNEFVEKGRENPRGRLALGAWADAMCGAALTMRIICSEAQGAEERAATFVNKAVAAFDGDDTASEIFLKNAKAMLPDMQFGNAADAEE